MKLRKLQEEIGAVSSRMDKTKNLNSLFTMKSNLASGRGLSVD